MQGVKFSYSSLSKGFTLKSTTTGSDADITLVNHTGNAFSSSDSAFGISEGYKNGQDAILRIENYDVVQSRNNFTIDGIAYSLTGRTEEPVSFTISQNIESSLEKITSFVSAYNDLVEELNDIIEEEQFSDYKPLTEDQKDEMSETEIEKWEEKAKSGVLRNDSNVSSLLSTMRSAFYTQVAALEANGTSIGLSTSPYTDDGQIEIDEARLREALENNADLVTSIFTSTSNATDPTQEYNESGIITRISNAMVSYTELTVDSSISILESRVDDAEDQLDVLENRYETKEETLWKKFSAMEAAMATLNSQSDWLASLFSASE